MVIKFLMISLVFAAYGIGMLLLGFIPIRRKVNLFGFGGKAEAVVREIKVAPTDKSYSYQYILEYKTDRGETATVRWDEYQHRLFTRLHPEGSSLTIFYDPSDTHKIAVKGIRLITIMQGCMILTGIALIGASVWTLFYGVMQIF